MPMMILLRNGKKLQFDDASVQKKDQGKIVAIYDRRTYRIIAEFQADQVSAWEPLNMENTPLNLVQLAGKGNSI